MAEEKFRRMFCTECFRMEDFLLSNKPSPNWRPASHLASLTSICSDKCREAFTVRITEWNEKHPSTISTRWPRAPFRPSWWGWRALLSQLRRALRDLLHTKCRRQVVEKKHSRGDDKIPRYCLLGAANTHSHTEGAMR